jgi:sec-independent protein translocase protein TatA
MPSIGPMELVVVLVVALLIFGPKRLPDAGRSLGSGLREFKEGLTGGARHQGPDTQPSETNADA